MWLCAANYLMIFVKAIMVLLFFAILCIMWQGQPITACRRPHNVDVGGNPSLQGTTQAYFVGQLGNSNSKLLEDIRNAAAKEIDNISSQNNQPVPHLKQHAGFGRKFSNREKLPDNYIRLSGAAMMSLMDLPRPLHDDAVIISQDDPNAGPNEGKYSFINIFSC